MYKTIIYVNQKNGEEHHIRFNESQHDFLKMALSGEIKQWVAEQFSEINENNKTNKSISEIRKINKEIRSRVYKVNIEFPEDF